MQLIHFQVQLQQQDQSGKPFLENKERWKVDLKQKSLECDGRRVTQVIATISGNTVHIHISICKVLTVGLWVTCLPRDQKFAGSNLVEVDVFFQHIKILKTSPTGGTLSWGSRV